MTWKFFSLFHNEHAHNIDLHLKSVELVLLLPDELPLPCGAVAPMEVVSNSRDSYPFLTKKIWLSVLLKAYSFMPLSF